MQLAGPEGTMEFDVDPAQDMIRISVGKVTKSFKKIDLWALVYAISGPNEQDKMMPVRRSEVLTYRRIQRIKLKNAMPAGGIVTCRCEVNVEQTIVEGLKGMVEQQASKVGPGGVPMIGQGK